MKLKINADQINELAASIKAEGLIQPIAARSSKDGYEIIAGERRWRACQLAGLHSIDAVIMNTSEEEVFELALIENIQSGSIYEPA